MKKILSLGFCLIAFVGAVSSASVDKSVLRLALTTEPPNLDSTKSTDAESFFILGHTMEGLTRYDQSGKTAPGVAERWELNDKTATFYLRKNAKWSDGKPVTAKDFVYSWKTAVDPKNASEYAFILYPIKNAEAINTKKMDLKELGVQAVDDYTLKITFEKPCGYFLALTTFATYYPLREDFHKAQGDKYASQSDKILANGPYVLTNWVHGASLKMEKNSHYWNAKNIKIDVLDVPYITPDDSARFNLFKDKKIDQVGLTKQNLASAQKEKFKLKKFPDGTLFYMLFNFREGRITSNKNLRKAIQLIHNSDEYINKVVGIPGTQPGQGLIPAWMMGKNQLFRKEYPLPKIKPDYAAAKKLVEKAAEELKIKGPISLVWLTTDSPLASREAEYFQSVFKQKLGIDLKIDKQIFKQRLAKMRNGDFDIASAGWGPDYNDPMTFADLFSSWNENNQGKWVNKDYDSAIRKAQGTSDNKIRMEAMAAGEKLLMEELPLLPLFERTIMYTHSDRVEGINRRSVGYDPDYTNARIVK